jgi:membrane fusion protein, multidrug efflux system
MNDSTPDSNSKMKSRRAGLTIVGSTVLGLAFAYGAWHWFTGRHSESTDNAYVAGNVVQISSQIAGTITSIEADESDMVKAGQALFKLDPADAQLALEQAQDQLAQSVREVKTWYANNATLEQQIKIKEADVTRAQIELSKATEDLNRRQPLLSSGGVGSEELEHAKKGVESTRNMLAQAQASLQAAKDQLISNQALTQGLTVQEHPNVKRAASKVQEAYLALHRTALVAPVNAHVAKRYAQLGQRVAPGATLMTLVSLDQLWVDANFKEAQLRNLHIGQPVELVADVYGSEQIYHGTISGLGSGTGSAFSLLPAQNATGNWIKVVQRVPVKITLNADELKAHPLRIGLSMEAKVDTQDQSGPTLAQAPRTTSLSSTKAFDHPVSESEALVKKIINSN